MDGPNNFLTDAQRTFYENNGFLVVKGCVAPEKLEKYRYDTEFDHPQEIEIELPFWKPDTKLIIVSFASRTQTAVPGAVHGRGEAAWNDHHEGRRHRQV